MSERGEAARPRAARGRAPARGDLPPLRLRLPRVRARVAAAAAVAARWTPSGVESISALQALRAARPGRDGAAAARPLDQRDGDVPRPDLLRGVPRAGGAAAAHVSVRPDLARRLLDRRGGVLDGDPARRGGPLRPRAHLRDRHQRGGARAARRLGVFPLEQDAGVHARTTSARAASSSFSEYYSPATTARCSRGRSSTASSSRSTTSSRTRPSTSST